MYDRESDVRRADIDGLRAIAVMLFLAVVTVASLAASVLVSARIPSFSFYLLPHACVGTGRDWAQARSSLWRTSR